MSASVHFRCVLCRDQVTRKPVPNRMSFCAKIFNCLLNTNSPFSCGPEQSIGGITAIITDQNEKLRPRCCFRCEELLMKFQALQHRLEELRTLNTEKCKFMTRKYERTSVEETEIIHSERSFDTAINGGARLYLAAVRSAGAAAGSRVKITVDDPISELTTEAGEPIQEIITELEKPVQELIAKAPEMMAGLTVKPAKVVEDPPEKPEGQKEEIGKKGEELLAFLRARLPDLRVIALTRTSPEAQETETVRSDSMSISASLSSVPSTLPNVTQSESSHDSRSTGGSIQGDRTDDQDAEPKIHSLADPVHPQVGSDDLQRQRKPRAVHGKITKLSARAFVYHEKHLFESTSLGYKCGSCDFQTTRSKCEWGFTNIANHIRKHHQESREGSKRKKRELIQVSSNAFLFGDLELEKFGDDFICKLCSVGLKGNVQHLRRHAKVHRERHSTDCICEICGKTYKSQDNLVQHKKTVHMEPTVPRPTCDDCGKCFKTSVALRQHRDRVHLKKFFCTCDSCGQQFYSKDSLRDHEYRHTGEKTFECQTCGKKFASSSSLYVHKRHHTGRKSKCDICGMEFTQSYSVTRHKNTAHPGWKKK